MTALRFVPTPGGGGSTYSGKVIVSGEGGRRAVPYETANEALFAVLDTLRRGQRGFLGKCAKDHAFRRTHQDGTTSQRLGLNRDDILEVRASRGELTKAMEKRVTDSRINPVRYARRWWVSRDTSQQQAWKMIQAAATIAGVQTSPNGRSPGI